jgi:outer membrane protein
MTAKNNLEQSKYNRLPTISASASQGYSTGQTIDPITSDFVSQSINSTSLGASANVVLFRGGYINNTIEKNRVIVKQNEFYVDQAKNNIILSVIEAYVQALSYNEAIKIAEQTKENSMVQYQVADGKYKAGSLSGIDLSNYETQIATDNLTLVNAKNDYKTQILKLKQLLEIPPHTDFDIQKLELQEDTAYLPSTDELYVTAETVLPDVRLLEIQKEGNAVDLKLAKSGYYPTVSLGGGLSTGYTNTQLNQFATQLRNNFSPSVNLNLSVPIFSQFANRTNVKNAGLAMKRTEIDIISRKKELYNTLETVIQNAVSAQAQLLSATTAVNSSKKSYDLALKKSELGDLGIAELTIAKNNYLNAVDQQIQAKLTYTLYQKLISFYQGTLHIEN